MPRRLALVALAAALLLVLVAVGWFFRESVGGGAVSTPGVAALSADYRINPRAMLEVISTPTKINAPAVA